MGHPHAFYRRTHVEINATPVENLRARAKSRA